MLGAVLSRLRRLGTLEMFGIGFGMEAVILFVVVIALLRPYRSEMVGDASRRPTTLVTFYMCVLSLSSYGAC